MEEMEVLLYNSTVCRLCGEDNESGTFLYSCEENSQNLSEAINTYLPIKVSDDGQLPRTICPGCTIQLEATTEFINLIINGQKIIRDLHQREKEYKKNLAKDASEIITEKIVYEINLSDGVYQVEHPIALQVAGLDKPKRKRGRPPKKPKSPQELEQEAAARAQEDNRPAPPKETEEPTGKRRRKAPTRFHEIVQGKELEKIFKEEGVTDGEDSDEEQKVEVPVAAEGQPKEPEVIGHMEDSGELVVVVKGKGRGRPSGRMRQTREECPICGVQFSCLGRYMSHIAQHGPVLYQCAHCQLTFNTRLLFNDHQAETQHTGQNVIPCASKDRVANDRAKAKRKLATASQRDLPSVEEPQPNTQSSSLPVLDVETVSKEDQHTPNELVNGQVNEPPDVIISSPIETDPLAIPDPIVVEDDDEKPTEPKQKARLKCHLCEKMFSSRQSKSMHIKAAHLGERPYVCGTCGATFAYPRSLALHALSHRRTQTSKGFACDLCGKVLNHPSSVVYHKEAEHAGQRYVCSKCNKSFKHKQLLQRHQLVHSQLRPYICKTCDSSFKTKANLINHQLLHTGVKKFACEICKLRFAHKTSLTLHMRWHTGIKPFACSMCDKSFSQKGNLSEHERIHTGERPYQCAQCPRRFTTSSQHRLHERRHQPLKPHACTHCGKKFATRNSWMVHQRRELGHKQHHCPVCPTSFVERFALRKHMRSHTGERPFKCTYCPRAFADCSNLNKHIKTIHKQFSLLVNKNQQQQQQQPQPEVIEQEQEQELDIKSVDLLEVEPDTENEEEGVIYVTYDVNNSEAQAYQIINTKQESPLDSKVVSTLYGGSSLLMSPPLAPDPLSEPIDLDNEHMSVTDEQGNPLHFTMQDGTRLAITSADGKSLQVITQDGQTIPVEINGFTEEEELESPDTPVMQLDVQKAAKSNDAPVTHYFTIVESL